MATFVHIFAEKDKASVMRSGIKIRKAEGRVTNGVFVSPVTENYFHTHQWQREVQRYENIPKLAARLKVPDDQLVFVGKYNEEHIQVSASEAIHIAMEHIDPMGLEVVIPRAITSKEIQKIYSPPKAVGWRYHPNAKGTKPCGCSYCQKGEPFSRKIKEKYERGME